MSKEVNPQSDTPEPKLPVLKYDLDLDSLKEQDSEPATLGNALAGIGSFSHKLAEIVKATANSPAIELARQLAEQSEKQREMLKGITIPAFPQIDLPTFEPLHSTIDYSDLTFPENPAHETNRLLVEVIQKLEAQQENNSRLVAPNFDGKLCEIIFATTRIPIRKDTNQAQLAATLFKKPSKEWQWVDVLESWHYTDFSKEDWRIVYEAARGLNEKVATKTAVPDFLIYTKKTVRINPAYLGSG